MKITTNSKPTDRKLIAVIGGGNEGVFIPLNGYDLFKSVYIGPDGTAQLENHNLGSLLKTEYRRTPVYEDEELILSF